MKAGGDVIRLGRHFERPLIDRMSLENAMPSGAFGAADFKVFDVDGFQATRLTEVSRCTVTPPTDIDM